MSMAWLSAGCSVMSVFSVQSAHSDLVISSDTLDFGSVPLGQTRTQTLEITNQSDAPVGPLRIDLGTSDFRITGGVEERTIEPGETRRVSVTFRAMDDVQLRDDLIVRLVDAEEDGRTWFSRLVATGVSTFCAPCDEGFADSCLDERIRLSWRTD